MYQVTQEKWTRHHYTSLELEISLMVIQLYDYGNHSSYSTSLILAIIGVVEPLTSNIHGPYHHQEKLIRQHNGNLRLEISSVVIQLYKYGNPCLYHLNPGC